MDNFSIHSFGTLSQKLKILTRILIPILRSFVIHHHQHERFDFRFLLNDENLVLIRDPRTAKSGEQSVRIGTRLENFSGPSTGPISYGPWIPGLDVISWSSKIQEKSGFIFRTFLLSRILVLKILWTKENRKMHQR